MRERTRVQWTVAPSPTALDPDRCLGRFSELPAFARPGDWCSVSAFDALGEMQWTLIAVEPERTESIFVGRRRQARLDEREWADGKRRLPLAG